MRLLTVMFSDSLCSLHYHPSNKEAQQFAFPLKADGQNADFSVVRPEVQQPFAVFWI